MTKNRSSFISEQQLPWCRYGVGVGSTEGAPSSNHPLGARKVEGGRWNCTSGFSLGPMLKWKGNGSWGVGGEALSCWNTDSVKIFYIAAASTYPGAKKMTFFS